MSVDVGSTPAFLDGMVKSEEVARGATFAQANREVICKVGGKINRLWLGRPGRGVFKLSQLLHVESAMSAGKAHYSMPSVIRIFGHSKANESVSMMATLQHRLYLVER